MKKEMTYNDVYTCFTLIYETSFLKLSSKAMTEKLLLRTHYRKAVSEFEEAKQSIAGDKDATDEAKQEAIGKKAAETVANFEARGFSREALEQIVEAAIQHETIPSAFATPKLDEKGGMVEFGKLPSETWLQILSENLYGE